MATRGGKKVKQILRDARKNARLRGGVVGVDAGFFRTARYQDGTLVSTVAAKNEFGIGVPERPFMRQSTPMIAAAAIRILRGRVDPKKMIVDSQMAGLVGESAKGIIQKRITDLRSPPNSKATILRKKGKSNPLIDSEKMRRSVTYKIKTF